MPLWLLVFVDGIGGVHGRKHGIRGVHGIMATRIISLVFTALSRRSIAREKGHRGMKSLAGRGVDDDLESWVINEAVSSSRPFFEVFTSAGDS